MYRYNVTDWDRLGWRYYKLEEPLARQRERAGEERWAADFGHFAEDVFHRMISEDQARRAPEPGSALWDKLHGEIDAMPEVADLRERCVGDERAAGHATHAIIDTILDACMAPTDGPLADCAADKDAIEALHRLIERFPEGSQERVELERHEGDISRVAGQHVAAAEKAAGEVDGPDLRKAVRIACTRAQEIISSEERMAEAFAAGQHAHSGRRDRREVGRKVSKLVAHSARLRKIVELAGRLKRIARDRQARKPDHGATEYTGIEIGAAIERVLPTELAMGTDPAFADLFAIGFIEQRLQQVELNARLEKEHGPIVMLLDSSGSMDTNQSAEWAAAVAMAFLDIAVTQRRGFVLVHFGDSVLRTDVFPAKQVVDPAKLADAVEFFAADGGTNFDAALTEGVNRVSGMEGADIVMITDGCASVSSDVLARVNKMREDKGMHVYSILIGMEPMSSVNAKFSDNVVELSQVLRDDSAMHAIFGFV